VVPLSLAYDPHESPNPRTVLTPTQNFGSSVGPALASALEKALGADGVAIQGVDYEASIASNINQGRDGGPVMAKLVQQAKSSCPDTKIALGGYSQGGFVVSNAIASSGVNPDDISAAVLYGDPSQKAAGGLDPSKVKDYCTSGDGVCAGTFAISAAHLAYTRYGSKPSSNRRQAHTDILSFHSNGMTDEGAAFIVSQTSGGSGTSSSSSGSTTTDGSASGSTPGGQTSTTSAAAATTGGSSLSSWTDLLSGGSSWFGN
jgi:hypothetical protein